jgi:hypothetical protein
MKRVSRKKNHEQSFKFKNAFFSPFNAKCTMQISSETKEQMKGFSFLFFLLKCFQDEKKTQHYANFFFFFQITMQRKKET